VEHRVAPSEVTKPRKHVTGGTNRITDAIGSAAACCEQIAFAADRRGIALTREYSTDPS
jgi:hypothetical protein